MEFPKVVSLSAHLYIPYPRNSSSPPSPDKQTLTCSEQVIKRWDIVDYSYVSNLKDRYYQKKEDRWFNRIWALSILHRWLEKNV